jgi:hypothetical protein
LPQPNAHGHGYGTFSYADRYGHGYSTLSYADRHGHGYRDRNADGNTNGNCHAYTARFTDAETGSDEVSSSDAGAASISCNADCSIQSGLARESREFHASRWIDCPERARWDRIAKGRICQAPKSRLTNDGRTYPFWARSRQSLAEKV